MLLKNTFFTLLLLSATYSFAQVADANRFEELGAKEPENFNFPDMEHPAKIQAYDYDGDGWIDILLAGKQRNSPPTFTNLFKNNNGTGFSLVSTPNISVGAWDGQVAWADYDNDGLPDVVITGVASGATGDNRTLLYKNNGNGDFSLVAGTPFVGVKTSSLAWADYNKDGRQDLLVAGNSAGANYISKLYRNDGNGVFTEVFSGTFSGVYQAAVTWADYDNDGYPDVFITGGPGSATRTAYLYKNNNGASFTKTTLAFEGADQSAAAWGDYNGDGYPDILYTGRTNSNTTKVFLYTNNGDGTFTNENTDVFTPSTFGSVAWCDFNADGLLDVFISGGGAGVNNLYKNNGDGTFTKLGFTFNDGARSSVSFADYDKDGRPDIFLNASGGLRLYHNLSDETVKPTTKPNGLTSIWNTAKDGVTFSWNAMQGSSYVIKIGTTSGKNDIHSQHNSIFLGKTNGGIYSYTLNFTPIAEQYYYWSVQQIDVAGNRSEWSDEQIFTLATLPVKLSHYEVKKENNWAKISWETASETNNDYFQVERLYNNQQVQVAKISSKNTGKSSYIVYDNAPQTGINYYKLTQTDLNGTITELGIRTVNFGLPTSDIRLYPNPSNGDVINLNIANNMEKPSKITISNINGKVVYQKNQLQLAESDNTISIQFGNRLKSGTYIIKVVDNINTYHQKFIVK